METTVSPANDEFHGFAQLEIRDPSILLGPLWTEIDSSLTIQGTPL
jgi:hypothetical protein